MDAEHFDFWRKPHGKKTFQSLALLARQVRVPEGWDIALRKRKGRGYQVDLLSQEGVSKAVSPDGLSARDCWVFLQGMLNAQNLGMVVS